MPITDGREIIDVDAPPDDNDERAKQIFENVSSNSRVNMNFDRDLLFVDDAIDKADTHVSHELHENDLMMLATVVNNDENDVKTNDAFIKDIVPKKSTVEKLSTPQNESTIKGPDTPQNVSLQFTSGDEGSVSTATASEADNDFNPKKSHIANVARLDTKLEN